MATRGRIGILREDGKVASIYNHWDSYPSWVGAMLFNHYTDKTKIEKLIAIGDISSLREEVDIPEGATHTFDDPIFNVTVAYGRDRGEENTEARLNESEDEYWKSDIEEYGYLFKNGKWYFKCAYWKDRPEPRELTQDEINRD